MARHQPRIGVVAAAGRRADDDVDRLAFEIVVRPAGDKGQRAAATSISEAAAATASVGARARYGPSGLFSDIARQPSGKLPWRQAALAASLAQSFDNTNARPLRRGADQLYPSLIRAYKVEQSRQPD
jgi:hypothetical protein